MKKSGYVYFAKNSTCYKIGSTTNLNIRIRQLRDPINKKRLKCVFYAETYYHKYIERLLIDFLRFHRISGKEWINKDLPEKEFQTIRKIFRKLRLCYKYDLWNYLENIKHEYDVIS